MAADLKLNAYKTPYSPCKGCADRCINCHTNCERYISWKAECDKARGEYIKVCNKERDFKDYGVEKTKRLGGKHSMW